MADQKTVVPAPSGERLYSPCYDGNLEYHLYVLWGRHPMLTSSPLRVHGVGTSRERAYSSACKAWARAYRALRASRGPAQEGLVQ